MTSFCELTAVDGKKIIINLASIESAESDGKGISITFLHKNTVHFKESYAYFRSILQVPAGESDTN